MSKIFDFNETGRHHWRSTFKESVPVAKETLCSAEVNCVGTIPSTPFWKLLKVRSPVIVQFSNGGAAFIAGKGEN